jgi:hypothetical protein
VHFSPTTYPSNNDIENSNQGLSVVKLVTITSFLKEQLDWFDRTLLEQRKETEIANVLVALKAFMIPK